MKSDSTYMRQALSLAKKGLGRTAPNPPVGAVVVKDGRVIGEGFHPKAGLPHAEVYALRDAGEAARGASLYVTLEPCSHHGRTPPCTEAVLAAGISRVVVGTLDPNPLVAGRGIERLRAAGLDVVVGVEEQQAKDLIRWYTCWMLSGRPFVIAKAAMTLDGRVATPGGDSKWISSEASRTMVHELRNHADGILVGIATVLKDDPQLTCRIEGGRDPLRIIIDRDYRVPPSARCLGGNCMVFTSRVPESRPEIMETGTTVVQAQPDASGRFVWEDILARLGAMGLHAILVEGGSSIHSSLIRSRLVDQILLFVAPKLLGGGIPLVQWGAPERIADAYSLVVTRVTTIGGDVLIEASLEDSCLPV